MLCRVGDGSVCNSIFEIVCHRLVHQVTWDVAIFHPVLLTSFRIHCRGLHRLESELVSYSCNDRICYRHYAGASYHAVGLAAMQMPHRKLALLIVDVQHRADEFMISVRLEQTVQRHGSAICIPKRECRILSISISFTDVVFPPIIATEVAELTGGNHCMIEGRVEYLPGDFVLSVDMNAAKLMIPEIICQVCRLIKVPTGELCLHVVVGALHAH